MVSTSQVIMSPPRLPLLLLITTVVTATRYSLRPAGFPLTNSSTCSSLCSISTSCTFYVWNSEEKTCSLSDKYVTQSVDIIVSGREETKTWTDRFMFYSCSNIRPCRSTLTLMFYSQAPASRHRDGRNEIWK